MKKNWYVVYTKARNEKKAALLLEKSGIDVYCPTVKEVRQWSDRKKTVEVPLFSSYLFVHLAPKERELVYAAPGWLSGEVLSAKVQNLKAGDSLCIHQGPFKGKDGVIQSVNANRVQLVLKELGLKVSITAQDAICA